MYRILLAEEQPATREAVRARLEKAGYEVVQEVNDGPTALRRTLDLKPDLLVLSLRLPRLGGLEVLRRMRQHGTKTKSLVMTSADSQHVVGMCMQAGASGFVSKTDDLSEITLAVQAISRNHTFFPGLQTAHGKSDPRMLTEAEQIASLSAREVTVLSYLADGYANRDICQALSLNSRTISTYKTRLFRKLNIASVVELAEVANEIIFWVEGSLEKSAGASSHGPSPTMDTRFCEVFSTPFRAHSPSATRRESFYLQTNFS